MPVNVQIPPNLIHVRTAAERYHRSTSTLRRWVDSGVIRGWRVLAALLVDPAEIERVLSPTPVPVPGRRRAVSA